MKSEKLKKGKEYAVPPADEELDASVEMTFPASDPPAVGGTTKLKEVLPQEHKPNASPASKNKTEQHSKNK